MFTTTVQGISDNYYLLKPIPTAVVCDDAERTKRQSKIEEAERIMAQATEQCQTMERLQKALRAINRKLEINKYYLKDHKKQLNKHRSELQAAKGGDPKFFDYTQQKIEEIEGTVQASVDSIETLNDQIKEEERQRRELIQQILQCKNDIEDMNCKLTTLKNELRRNMQQLEREKNLLIEKIPVILQDLDDAAARAGTAIGVLGGVAGFVGGSAALAFGGNGKVCYNDHGEVRANVRTKSLGPTVLKALCPYLRSNCFLMSSLVQKFN